MMPKVTTCISNGLHTEILHNLCRSTYLHQLAGLCDFQKYSSQPSTSCRSTCKVTRKNRGKWTKEIHIRVGMQRQQLETFQKPQPIDVV